MGTITKAERQGLDELFISMQEKRNFLMKLRHSRKEMIRLFQIMIKNQKTNFKQ